MTGKKNISVTFRVWLFSNNEKLLGKGRVELLERIDKSGSIATAAKEMKMSYRQAWQMVEEMNGRALKPFVEKKLGGKSGGGAILTEAGKSAITQFRALENKTMNYILKEAGKLNI